MDMSFSPSSNLESDASEELPALFLFNSPIGSMRRQPAADVCWIIICTQWCTPYLNEIGTVGIFNKADIIEV